MKSTSSRKKSGRPRSDKKLKGLTAAVKKRRATGKAKKLKASQLETGARLQGWKDQMKGNVTGKGNHMKGDVKRVLILVLLSAFIALCDACKFDDVHRRTTIEDLADQTGSWLAPACEVIT